VQGKKDKKRNAVEVVDDPDLAKAKAAAKPPASYAEEDAPVPEEGQKGSRSNVSLVPKSTAEYLKVGQWVPWGIRLTRMRAKQRGCRDTATC
jgi:hypothetical protein